MKLKIIAILCLCGLASVEKTMAQPKDSISYYTKIIRTRIFEDYKGMLKQPKGALIHPFITPGSSQYNDQLWDWDSWLTNIALRQIALENSTDKERKELLKYEKGCVLNFLEYGGMNGWIPYMLSPTSSSRKEMMGDRKIFDSNMHKPCLAQHAAFIIREQGGDPEWIREYFFHLQAFVNAYMNQYQHKETGLFFWATDDGVGVDNDPSVFSRPYKSSGNIFLNSLMYKELLATAYIAKQLNQGEIAVFYENEAEALKQNIIKHCWDPKDGFFYSVDLNLVPTKRPDVRWQLHVGGPRNWDCLIQRIGSWSGFCALWANIATPEQARQVVEKNYRDTATFNAPYGVRTLSKMEKMYNVRATGNPSNWLGPIWIISNYMTFKGLVNYGYNDDARELAVKTIKLLGRDYERFGALHEYYLPESGEPVLNKGFQNWNYLVLNMIAWLEGKKTASEL